MNVVVTGGSGKTGTAVVRELREHGHDVLTIDRSPPRDPGPAKIVELRDLGQTIQCLLNTDAVVHLAAIPNGLFWPDGVPFVENVTSTYNVFEAARILGIERVVWASSETVYGLPFELEPPAYVPFDEESEPRPESGYALGKLLCEELARQYWRRAGIASVALRLSNVLEPAEYDSFATFWADPGLRAVNCWNYVDIRDAARAFRLALEAPTSGAEIVSIAAPDTVMDRPSHELMAEIFPATEVRPLASPFASLLSSAKANELIGYTPQHSWRDER